MKKKINWQKVIGYFVLITLISTAIFFSFIREISSNTAGSNMLKFSPLDLLLSNRLISKNFYFPFIFRLYSHTRYLLLPYLLLPSIKIIFRCLLREFLPSEVKVNHFAKRLK